MTHECDQAEKIDSMADRLHLGDLTLQKIHSSLERHGESLTRIETQVSKTNGRVTKLEKLRTTVLGILVGTALATTSGPAILKTLISLFG